MLLSDLDFKIPDDLIATRPAKPRDESKLVVVGNDLKMDPGIGTCGKNGQGVPVGVGQPTLKIENLTVGGTSN